MPRKVRVTPISNKPAETELLALVASLAKPSQIESLKAFNAVILSFDLDSEVQSVFEHLQGQKIKGKELSVTCIGQADPQQAQSAQQQQQTLQKNLDNVFKPELLKMAVPGKSYGDLHFGMSSEEVKKIIPQIKLQDWNKIAAENLRFFSLKGGSLPGWKYAAKRLGKTGTVTKFLKDPTTPLLNKQALKEIMDELTMAELSFLFDPQDRLSALGFILSDEGPSLQGRSPLGLSRSQFQDFFAEDENQSSIHHGAVSLQFGLWAEFIDQLNPDLLHSSRCSRLLMFAPNFTKTFFVKAPVGEPPRWDWFWSLIPVNSKQTGEQRLENITQALKPLAHEELLIFREHLGALVHRAYSPMIEGFARVTNQGGSDDSYQDFVHWLISKGRSFFETALVNADKLAAENIENDLDEVQLDDIASALYAKTSKKVTSKEAFTTDPGPVSFAFPEHPNVQRDWDDEDLLKKTFPKLYKRFQ